MIIKLYKNRYFRTIFLALFATATFVGSAIFIFDVEAKVMLQFFLASVLGVGILMLAAFLFTAIRVLLRKWLNGN